MDSTMICPEVPAIDKALAVLELPGQPVHSGVNTIIEKAIFRYQCVQSGM